MAEPMTEEQKKAVEEMRRDLYDHLDEVAAFVNKYHAARAGVEGPDNLFANNGKCTAGRASKMLAIHQIAASKAGKWDINTAIINTFANGVSFGIYLGELGFASFFLEQQKK